MGADKVRCRYTDCPEHHPEAMEDEKITCATCREYLGLPPLYRLWNSARWQDRARAWVLGFREAPGCYGITWAHDQGLNEAYDRGRAFRRGSQ